MAIQSLGSWLGSWLGFWFGSWFGSFAVVFCRSGRFQTTIADKAIAVSTDIPAVKNILFFMGKGLFGSEGADEVGYLVNFILVHVCFNSIHNFNGNLRIDEIRSSHLDG